MTRLDATPLQFTSYTKSPSYIHQLWRFHPRISSKISSHIHLCIPITSVIYTLRELPTKLIPNSLFKVYRPSKTPLSKIRTQHIIQRSHPSHQVSPTLRVVSWPDPRVIRDVLGLSPPLFFFSCLVSSKHGMISIFLWALTHQIHCRTTW